MKLVDAAAAAATAATAAHALATHPKRAVSSKPSGVTPAVSTRTFAASIALVEAKGAVDAPGRNRLAQPGGVCPIVAPASNERALFQVWVGVAPGDSRPPLRGRLARATWRPESRFRSGREARPMRRHPRHVLLDAVVTAVDHRPVGKAGPRAARAPVDVLVARAGAAR